MGKYKFYGDAELNKIFMDAFINSENITPKQNEGDLISQMKSLIDIANKNGLTKAAEFLKKLTDETNF